MGPSLAKHRTEVSLFRWMLASPMRPTPATRGYPPWAVLICPFGAANQATSSSAAVFKVGLVQPVEDAALRGRRRGSSRSKTRLLSASRLARSGAGHSTRSALEASSVDRSDGVAWSPTDHPTPRRCTRLVAEQPSSTSPRSGLAFGRRGNSGPQIRLVAERPCRFSSWSCLVVNAYVASEP
jgi:hypothetical protein